MKALVPATTATREAAAWWLDGVRAELPAGTPVREVDAVVRRHAARVSHVVLAVACRVAEVPDAGHPATGVLIGRLVAAEQRRLLGVER